MKHIVSTILAIFALLGTAISQNSSYEVSNTHLNFTATVGRNNVTVLECWALTEPFITYHPVGMSTAFHLFLGDLVNATYDIVPARIRGGAHRTPYKQWVVALSGIAHITLPSTTPGPMTEVWLPSGRHGLSFAADTPDVSATGHAINYPSDEETVIMLIPTAGNVEPEHIVLYDGPCTMTEILGESEK